jgi:hypothetical protein
MGTIDPSWRDQLRKNSLLQKIRRVMNKYILQRDAAALKDDTDADEAKLGEELQLALDGSPWIMGTSTAPSMDSPLASSGIWLQQLATGGDSEEAHR